MLKHTTKLILSLSFLLAACVDSGTDSTTRPIIDTPCADDAGCPAGFECEIEDEHGTVTSFCQAHEEDTACPDGLELEIEHGQEMCVPHGGDDSGGTDDGTGDDNGGTTGGGTDDPPGDDHGGV
jgi:hypothetical protein